MTLLKHTQLETIVKESFQIEDLFSRSRKTNIIVARSVYFFYLGIINTLCLGFPLYLDVIMPR